MNHFVDTAGLRSFVSGADRPLYFHVAGTNGKGSVTAFLQHALVSAGFRTGAFFSPYVVDPRERIQIGTDLILEQEFAEVASQIRETSERMEKTEFGGVTEFEFKTAMGFLAWKRANCGAVALEVGLGGRLDATNVVAPAACGIVSIGLDHTAILGPDIASIASEKAGIIKSGVPVVVGEMEPAALERIEHKARLVGSPVWRVGIEILYDDLRVSTPAGSLRGVQPRLTGRWQMHNAAVAIAMLHAAGITDPSIADGINSAFAPGRFEVRNYLGQLVILDGAHNGPAAGALVETLLERYPGVKFTLITNLLAGHHSADFYEPLTTVVENAIVAPIFNARARSTEEARQELEPYFSSVEVVSTIADAFKQATGPILVTGSNYLVGDAIRFMETK
jgi:dihydrofolate synthase/folylpolyglutamate synthase